MPAARHVYGPRPVGALRARADPRRVPPPRPRHRAGAGGLGGDRRPRARRRHHAAPACRRHSDRSPAPGRWRWNCSISPTELIARINTHLGAAAAQRLRFVQDAPASPPAPAPRPPPDAAGLARVERRCGAAGGAAARRARRARPCRTRPPLTVPCPPCEEGRGGGCEPHGTCALPGPPPRGGGSRKRYARGPGAAARRNRSTPGNTPGTHFISEGRPCRTPPCPAPPPDPTTAARSRARRARHPRPPGPRRGHHGPDRRAETPRSLGKRGREDRRGRMVLADLHALRRLRAETFPELRAKLIDTGKLRWVFRDFPLDQVALRPPMVARALPPDRYEPFIIALFAGQDRWAFAQRDQLRRRSCGRWPRWPAWPRHLRRGDRRHRPARLDPAAADEAEKRWKIDATPSFVFNGHKVRRRDGLRRSS